MKTLELFCGRKSFSKVFDKYGHKTTTTDIDPIFNPDIVKDILELNVCDIGLYDIIWASPPCETFSVASIGHHWNKDNTPKTKECILGMKILDKTIQIISELKPKYFFIENPRGKMRKVIDDIFKKYGIEYKRETICYCRYGDTRMKPTDIWTNCFEYKPIDKMCFNGCSDHIAAPRGSRTGTQGLKDYETRSEIPEKLIEEIYNTLSN